MTEDTLRAIVEMCAADDAALRQLMYAPREFATRFQLSEQDVHALLAADLVESRPARAPVASRQDATVNFDTTTTMTFETGSTVTSTPMTFETGSTITSTPMTFDTGTTITASSE